MGVQGSRFKVLYKKNVGLVVIATFGKSILQSSVYSSEDQICLISVIPFFHYRITVNPSESRRPTFKVYSFIILSSSRFLKQFSDGAILRSASSRFHFCTTLYEKKLSLPSAIHR